MRSNLNESADSYLWTTYIKKLLVLFRYLSNLVFEIVKNSLIKYQSNISRITLLGYLLIFVLNIFHFHKIDLKLEFNYFLSSESTSRTYDTSRDTQCRIHQNFNSLHSFVFSNLSGFISNRQNEIKITFGSENSFVNPLFNLKNHLRAPPFFSWPLIRQELFLMKTRLLFGNIIKPV